MHKIELRIQSTLENKLQLCGWRMPNTTLVCTYLIVFQVLDFYIAKTLKEEINALYLD